MALSEIVIIEEGEQSVVQITDEGFSVEVDGQEYTPAVTEDIQADKSVEGTTLNDQCGNYESRATNNRGWSVTVKGIVTANDRDGNLTMQFIRDTISNLEQIEITCDLYRGPIQVNSVSLGQGNGLNEISTTKTVGKEKAYEFQLQLGEPEGEGQS